MALKVSVAFHIYCRTSSSFNISLKGTREGRYETIYPENKVKAATGWYNFVYTHEAEIPFYIDSKLTFLAEYSWDEGSNIDIPGSFMEIIANY